MKPISALSLIIALASVLCVTYAAHAGRVEDGKSFLASTHIVGDSETDHNIYPYRPAVFDLELYKGGKHIRTCKGFEIGIRKWMTAAECVDQEKYENVVLVHMLRDRFETYQYAVKDLKAKVHPKYNEKSKENNIAVITSTATLDTDSNTVTMKASSKGQNYLVGRRLDVFLKWKNVTKETDKKDTYKLHSIPTKVINSFWCKLWYPLSPIKNINTCVSGWYGKGLDQNDVGIPLVIKESDGSFQLVGMATVVRPWAHWLGLPIEFLNLIPYLNWITSN